MAHINYIAVLGLHNYIVLICNTDLFFFWLLFINFFTSHLCLEALFLVEFRLCSSIDWIDVRLGDFGVALCGTITSLMKISLD